MFRTSLLAEPSPRGGGPVCDNQKPAPKRVLLVDDDADLVETVGHALEERGYVVLVARDGTEGLMRAERDNPDLILLDVIMPRRSGFTVLSRLEQGGHSSPIIMMSGNDDERHRTFATEHGANDFLHKPFDVEQLLVKVDAILAG
jgi:DNA-binding response OmpR family regulator